MVAGTTVTAPGDSVVGVWEPHVEPGYPPAVSAERRVGFADSNGEPISYEVVGAGAPLVLCHGAGGNHASWFHQVATFSDRYRVITWDHRAFGRSSSASGVGDPTVSIGYLGALLDAAGADRAHVVGQSMGGWTALGFTLAHRERSSP
jgi:3-oxoadipate enol-lactonase